MKLSHKYFIRLKQLSIVLSLLFFISCSKSPEIVVQKCTMQVPEGKQVFTEKMLVGEVAETEIEHVAYVGPISQTMSVSKENVNMYIFIKGNGTLKADTTEFALVPESIAIPSVYDSITIEVPEGEVLHYILFSVSKKSSLF